MTAPTYKEALIKGVFSPEQAREIIGTLFMSKIKMHTDAQFRNWVTSSSSSPEDSRRRQELTESLHTLLNALENLPAHGAEQVKLDCELKMTFVTKP
ncbi:MAG: hypothetical protein ACT6QS_15050 [Flavobacteriales bacterium]